MKKLLKQTMILGTSAMIAGASLGMAANTFADEQTEAVVEGVKVIQQSFGEGILKASIPENENWMEVLNEEACVTITNGANTIVFNHYSNPADLPKVASFDDQHEMSYEIAFSKADASITLVAEIAHTDDYASVKRIMNSIEVSMDKLDDAHIQAKHELNKEQFTVKDVNYDAWVNAMDGLCIRQDGSADAAYITTEPYGAKLNVSGEILKNDVDTGWRKVTDANGISGYCYAQFLSLSELAAKEEEPKKDISNYPQTVAVFCAGDLRYIYLCNNGQYTDYDGNLYNASADFMTFVRVSDGLIYHEATSMGYDPTTWFGTDEETEEYYKSMSRSDSIANVLDRAVASGLFTQEEIDNAVTSIMELQNQYCETEEQRMSRSDKIAGILNGMQQEMIDNGYLAY